MRILNISYIRRYSTTTYVYIKGLESIYLRKLLAAKKGRGFFSGYYFKGVIFKKNPPSLSY